ncbi:type II toxin-antitoxin system VapC family toxin [Candidatus Woesearchaeota archaeon]|nr:type II toxin-antitoxin system VapC family toxin [Candidatus Woesearchaeota archaeon]
MIQSNPKTTLGDFFPKFGIDSNVLIDLVLYPKAKEYFKQKGYSFPDKSLCILPDILGEVKGVLINRYKYSKEKADTEIDKLLEEFDIEKLPQLVIEKDSKTIEEIGDKYQLNGEDIPIIYQFWKLKVKKILVRDNAFEQTCKELNISIEKWPKF